MRSQQDFERAVLLAELPWKLPHVSADEEGALTYEWWHGRRKLTVYANDEPEILRVSDDAIDQEPLAERDFVEHWRWLLDAPLK